MFWVEGNDLHFERPALSSTDDCEFSFGEDLKTFLPSANFRKPAVSVEVGAWDSDGKAEITGKAKKGQELWTVPGGKPGADQARFTSTKTELSLVESQVSTQAHADTVARAALTKRAMEFLTAEVEVQGDPRVRPGAMVNIKKVGVYSGQYLVTEANHFYDAAGYDCIFYVARDKWGNSSRQTQPPPATAAARTTTTAANNGKPQAQKKEEPITLAGILEGAKGPLKNWPFKLLRDGNAIGPQQLGAAKTDNQFKSGAWRSSTGGRYKFEGLRKGSWKIQVLLAAATAAEGDQEPARESGHRSEQGAPDAPRAHDHISLEAPAPAVAGDATPSATASFDAAHFETDKALPLPASIPVFRAIAGFLAQNKGRTLLVVGHTDAVGTAAHNLVLSKDRAEAVAAYLRDDADAWMRFYGHSAASSKWGAREDQLMLSAVPFGGTPFYGGAIDGISGAQTTAALKRLQKKSELPETGKADDKTRRALILEYMKAEGTSIAEEPQILACGERHLLEDTQGASEANRRVDVFAFESEQIDPAPDECRNGQHPGCDVYERWKAAAHKIHHDPQKGPFVLRLVHGAATDVPLSGVRVRLTFPDGRAAELTSDEDGFIRSDEVPAGDVQVDVIEGELAALEAED
jgi:outer membrane protein OmpA-like peptidoglycan-associated protein